MVGQAFLAGLFGTTVLTASRGMAAEGQADTPRPLPLGPSEPFSFDRLVERARTMAGEPFRPVEADPAALPALNMIDYDEYQKISFDIRRSLFRERAREDALSPIAPFHLHKGLTQPVGLHVIEGEMARRVMYDASAFSYSGEVTPAKLPADLGYGGFRALYGDREGPDWLAFMGASYFRTAGPFDQYGLSARAVAVDIGLPDTPEEFPRFTDFWLEPAHDDDGGVLVYALIDSPSLSGAMRMACARGEEQAIRMDCAIRLFMRKDVRRLGIAPITSMFWFSETNRHDANDWRPEVHDTDGLALWTGSGERLWRPLTNPKAVSTNSFLDNNPQGFGLLQRDRQFDHYQDDGVFYERRPSLWVEPKGAWGEGMVQLLEIPTDDEIHDNIGAYWTTDKVEPAGSAVSRDYSLYWTVAPMIGEAAVGYCVATRMGRAGIPGQPRPESGVKYAVDFEGGSLGELETGALKPKVSVGAGGRVDGAYALRVVGTDIWRIVFDLYTEGEAPVDVRAYLVDGEEKAATETWTLLHRPHSFS